MEARWTTTKDLSGRSYERVELCEYDDFAVFDRAAEVLKKSLAMTWTERLSDGFSTRYWDLEANGGKLTLHVIPMVGVSLFPTEQADASLASLALLRRAAEVLLAEPIPPKRPWWRFWK